MSKTVDQRVVEMRFDNRHFEQNVRTSMSTLDKLKQKLNFTGATKGLENVGAATKKVSFDGMIKGIDTVDARFSYLQMSIQHQINRIVDTVTNAGLRIAKALTIDPVKTGFNEYELKMDSVRTIIASTGEDIKTVNKYLNELNEYSDRTIYSFSDMTQNIGKFTNAGVKLEDAVIAMKGLSNEAAVSGANANEASRAMYNFAQALSMGYVQLIDWKSIENANMATVEFKQQLLDTAVAIGTVTKQADGMYSTGGKVFNLQQMFKDGLQDQWLTTDVLISTLKDYGDETTEIGKKAYAAAENVTTLTQMWSVLKETAQSGWAQTWEIIVGDFNQAKALFTPLTNFFSNIISNIDDARNKLLNNALTKSFKGILDNVKNIAKPIEKSADSIKNVVKTVQDYANVVDEIINGKWGNGQARWDALTKAGYDWAHAQNQVNEKLGVSLRRATDYKEEQNKVAESTEKATEATTKQIIKLTKLSDEQLRNKGYTDDQIKALRDLENASKKTGIPLKELIDNIDQINGRWLLLNSFKNIGMSLVSVFKSIGQAWKAAFPPMSANTLFDIIAGFHKLSTVMRKYVEKNANNLMRTFRGLFSVLGLVKDVLSIGFRVAGAVLKEVFKILGFGTEGLLSFTASIGDAVYKTRQWIKENKIIDSIVNKIVPKIFEAANSVKKWADSTFHISENLEKLINKLKSFKSSITDLAKGIKDAEDIPKYIFEGLANGLTKYGSKAVEGIINIGKSLIDGICNILGIHSPSTVFMAIGGFIIAGLVLGLQNGVPQLFDAIKNIGLKCAEIFNNIDFGKLFAAGLGLGMLLMVKEILDIVKSFENIASRVTAPLKGVGDLLSGLGSMFTDQGKANKIEAVGKTVKNIAIAVAILAGSILLLSKIKTGDLLKAGAVILVLTGVVTGLYFLISKISENKGLKDTAKATMSIGSLIGISAALFIAAMALKKLASIEYNNIGSAIFSLIAIIALLGTLIFAIGKCIDPSQEKYIQRVGTMIRRIAMALLMMVLVVKLASMLKPEDVTKGLKVIGALELLVLGMVAIAALAGDNADKAGKMIKKIAWSLLIMIGVIKLASMLKAEEIVKGLFVIGVLSLFIKALIDVSMFAGKYAAKAGTMLLEISVALLIMVGVIKAISVLSDEEVKRGLTVVSGIGLIFTALIAISNLAGKNAIKAGTMILMIAGALVMLTGVLFILSKIDPSGLNRAVAIVSWLEILFGGLIAVTKYAKDCTKTLITILVAISLLIAIVIGLSFIDTGKLAMATASVTGIMGMLAVLMLVTKYTRISKNLYKTLVPIVAAVGVLALIVAGLSLLDPQSVLASAGALTMLMTSLVAALYVTSLIKSSTAKKAVTSLALMGLVVGELALIVGIMSALNLENSIQISGSLSILLLSMTASLAVLSLVGAAWPAALIGIGCLAAFIVAMGGLIAGIGALVDKFPKLEEFIDRGIPILEKIGIGLGSFVGGIINGVLSSASKALPEIGTNLSNFMTNLSGFIEGAKTIDESVVKGIGYLSLAIMGLSGAELINGITNFFSGNLSLAQFGTELSQFMINALPFLTTAMTITPEMAAGVKNLADAILAITGANLLQSITGWLSGETSLEDFGAQLGSLGTSLNTFVSNLGVFTEDQVTTVSCAGKALKALAQAANEIPNEGGWAAKIFGDNSISAFGSQLPGFATNFNTFVSNLGTFSEDQVTTVSCAGRALKALADAASKIPNEGGLWAAIFGDNSISTFGNKLPGLATHLNEFITNLGTFDESHITTVDCAGKAIKALASAAKDIPNEGGLWAAICGDNSLSTFGSKLPGLATNLKDFVANLGTFSEAQIVTVTSACSAIRAIAKLGEINIQSTGDGLAMFGNNMVSFAKKIKDFVDNISGTSGKSIDSAIKKANKLIEFAQTAANVNIQSLSTFGTSLKKFAKDGANGFVKELGKEDHKSKAKKAGEALVKSFGKGIEDKKDTAKKKAKTVGEEAVKGLGSKSLKSDAETAGKYFVQGFANGIKNNKYLATNAASSLGKAALKAAKKAIDSNSPSKETHKLGNYFGQGFVIGIKEFGSKVYDTAYNVGDKARNGLSRAINKVSTLIDSDIDVQPTIRPVLDLSDIRSGAGYLNTMFDNQSIGVTSNLNAISRGMNSRIQNATNDDVVSAVNKLGKKLDSISGDTYNINGVTYDDGSNITDAVRTLIRAANVERRT